MEAFWMNISLRGLVVCSTLFLTTCWFCLKRRVRNEPSKYQHLPLPPSPPGLPLFGNMLSMRTNMRPILKEWTQKLGGIFNIRVGPGANMIVISDVDVMQEAFVDKANHFSGRTIFPLVEISIGGKGSFIHGSNDVWKKTRKLGVQALRSFGVGKTSMEHRIQEESHVLVDIFKKKLRSPFDPRCSLTNGVANVVSSIVLGRRYEHDDPVFEAFVRNMNLVHASISITSLGSAFPMLYYTPLYKNYRVPLQEMVALIKDNVKDHERVSETVTEVRDIVDFLRSERAKSSKLGSDQEYDAELEWRGAFDLFVAGILTSSDTLTWALLLLAKYPEVQVQCQKDIDDVIGSGKIATMADKDKMPVLTATIQEIMRYRPVIPLGVPRENDEETVLHGYRIPKGSAIIMNIWEHHMNPKYWDEPDKFNPSRFLSEDGKKVTCPPAWMPFGIGLRICLGENLGRMMTYLILTNLLQKFTFRLADESKSVDMDGHFGVALSTCDYKLIVEERQLK